MRIQYSISLWNYSHYASLQSLEHELALIRAQGYGVELWSPWRGEADLFDQVGRARLRPILQGMRVSLHTAVVNTFELHRKQIDAAADLGAEVVVLHSDDLLATDRVSLDVPLARDVVSYAADHGVKLALENGQLRFLERAIEEVDGLGICLDVGHVYLTPDPMSSFLDALKHHIIHLHLQDVASDADACLPGSADDHYVPGTGAIPEADWELLAETLREIDFQGTAVLEIRPRTPLQTALLATRFLEPILGNGSDRSPV
jgi:sugar phosphate isomerase/epimerase